MYISNVRQRLWCYHRLTVMRKSLQCHHRGYECEEGLLSIIIVTYVSQNLQLHYRQELVEIKVSQSIIKVTVMREM
jgi:hypothetical protein